MKLYYLPGTCSLAIHIVLEWIGEPYEAVAVTREQTKTPKYLKMNPAGAVPVLANGGRVLTQNSAIQKYLIEQYPQANLGPDPAPEGNYELNHWHGFLGGDLHPGFRPYFAPQQFHPDESAHTAIRAAAFTNLQRLYGIADRHMDGRDHVIAGRRTVIDAYLFTFSSWAARGFPNRLGDFPHLKRFVGNMLADPGVARVLADEGVSFET
ncbi:MAG: glutathione S-transferase N-terminal domain-containing protein [Rhodospirillaceae bacterium]|nr:glutathione S-transferase N-terminal domain-containing protein [Rhodospirillaceae bacterium]